MQKVADAYELLGLVDDKERILEKYAALLSKTDEESKKKSNRVKSRRKETSGDASYISCICSMTIYPDQGGYSIALGKKERRELDLDDKDEDIFL